MLPVTSSAACNAANTICPNPASGDLYKYFLDSAGATYSVYFLSLSTTNGITKLKYMYSDYLETILNL